ncbi:MAG: single-stranded-DNA-specific exonuclease RecJ [Spirochaetes bacterium]|nr:single-stranded-DNA-specific exonuclease RecJ [Spirochaetota bacterium]
MNERWVISEIDATISEKLVKALRISKPLADVLVARGICDPNEAYNFLNPSCANLHNPFLLQDMFCAVKRFRMLIERKENIALFADSDVDGLTSLAVLSTLLYRLSPNHQIYLRYPQGDEHYGLTNAIVDELIAQKVKFLITLDCGSKDINEISYALSNGIETLVIDHHELGETLPTAIVINPKRKDCNYPYKDLAGVGVVFKFCNAVLFSYLPMFSQRILIVSGENEIEYAIVHQGVIAEKGDILDFNNLIEKISTCDSVMWHRCEGIIERAKRELPKLYIDLEKELEFVTKNDVDANRYDCNFFERGINSAVRLFNELLYKKSPKIIEFNKDVLSFVAIGTIADIVPLRDENRILVHMGIEALKETKHEGLAQLVCNKEINSKMLSWHIAPILNAPGRMGMPAFTAKFLLHKCTNEKENWLNEILVLNNQRREKIELEFSKFIELFERGNIHPLGNLIVVEVQLPEGLIGLMANKISEHVKKPVIVFTKCNGGNIVKGSGRVKGEYDFFSRIIPYADRFEKIGGHAQAFGFTIKEEMLHNTISLIAKSVNADNFLPPKDQIDCILDIRDVTLAVAESMELLEPTGKGNEEPIFLTKGAIIRNFWRMGHENQHGKYLFYDNKEVEAVGWKLGDVMERCAISSSVDIVYKLNVAVFNGRKYPLMLLMDVMPSQFPDSR